VKRDKKEPAGTEKFEALKHQRSSSQCGFPYQMKTPSNVERFSRINKEGTNVTMKLPLVI
jgi:hypothetical protein